MPKDTSGVSPCLDTGSGLCSVTRVASRCDSDSSLGNPCLVPALAAPSWRDAACETLFARFSKASAVTDRPSCSCQQFLPRRLDGRQCSRDSRCTPAVVVQTLSAGVNAMARDAGVELVRRPRWWRSSLQYPDLRSRPGPAILLGRMPRCRVAGTEMPVRWKQEARRQRKWRGRYGRRVMGVEEDVLVVGGRSRMPTIQSFICD